MTRTGVRFLTVDWLDGPIRICTAGYARKYEPHMVWAPIDPKATLQQRTEVDRKLEARVRK